MATSSPPLAPPPSPAVPPPLAIRDGAARDRDGAAMPLGGDRLQNDTPPMLLGSPPLAPRDGSAMQPGGGQLEMDEMDEEGRTRHHARMCAAPLALPPHPTAAVSRNEEAGLNRQPAPLRVGPSVRVLSTKDRVYLSKRPPQPSPGPSLRPRVFMLTCAGPIGVHACRLNNGLALASHKVQTPDNLEMDEMDEEERTRHLRRLRKRGVDSNFPAPPPLEFSRRCNGTCQNTVPIMPGEPGRGRMHVFPSRPPRRIAGCLEGAELEAARAEWHALDKTDEREAMRRARNLAMDRSAPRREGDSAEPRRGARRETERELLAISQ